MLPRRLVTLVSIISIFTSLIGNFLTVAYAADTQGSAAPISFTINNGQPVDTSLTSVKIVFSGLDPKSSYKYCLNSNINDNCTSDTLKKVPLDSNASTWEVTVCGNGADKLKTSCGDDDWFHVVSTYALTLYDSDNNEITSASFLVAPIFPVINIPTPNGSKPVSITVNDNGDVEVNGNTVDDWITAASPDPQISNPISASISQSALNQGGSSVGRQNNYRIELDSDQSDYSVAGCVTVKGDQNASSSVKSDKPLKAGSYELDVQDQVNDSGIANAKNGAKTVAGDIIKTGIDTSPILAPIKFSVGFLTGGGGITSRVKSALGAVNPVNDVKTSLDTCQGGFTYYYIPINVDQNGVATIDVASIEADPENWYLTKDQTQTLGLLPCTAGVNVSGTPVPIPTPNGSNIAERMSALRQISDCTEYSTALANVGITPISFIQSFAKILLEIGGIAVLGYLVYAGWLILTSRGDKEKIQKAREMITSAVIGFIFIVLSFTILGFIGVDVLQLPGFSR